jgi:hypothetical protein
MAQGYMCDIDYDECASSPCLNGGHCVDSGRRHIVVAGQATVVMHHNITYHVERPDATTEKVRSSRSVPNSVEATFDQELGYGQACMVRADPPPQVSAPTRAEEDEMGRSVGESQPLLRFLSR